MPMAAIFVNRSERN